MRPEDRLTIGPFSALVSMTILLRQTDGRGHDLAQMRHTSPRESPRPAIAPSGSSMSNSGLSLADSTCLSTAARASV